MESRKKKRQTLKKIRAILIALIIITIIVVSAINAKRNKNTNNVPNINKDVSLLKGTFIYGNDVKYVFNEDNTGALYDHGNKYEYKYTIHDQQVTLTFKDPTVHEATYTFYFIDDDLKLIAGIGTKGGEYILKKEK